MATQNPLFQVLVDTLKSLPRVPGLHQPGLKRLAILVTAIATTRSTKIQVLARAVIALGLSSTRNRASVERRIRRTLDDFRLSMPAMFQPVVRTAIPWEQIRRSGEPLFLIVDESNRNATEHLLRIGLAVWGDALTLAFQLWKQNTKLKPGTYWQAFDTAFAEVAAFLPVDLFVVFLADRAFDIPPFLDRLLAHGWHFVVRLKGNSDVRYRDPKTGASKAVRLLLLRYCAAPGTAYKTEITLFQNAGWRKLSLQAVWGKGCKERLVVISDLPLTTDLIAMYDKRFWIEASFRHSKSQGLQWETSGVRGLDHHERLLIAMAWVTLLALSNGLTEAIDGLARLARSARRATTVQAYQKESVFTMGLGMLRGAIRSDAPRPTLHLIDIAGTSWSDRCKQLALSP